LRRFLRVVRVKSVCRDPVAQQDPQARPAPLPGTVAALDVVLALDPLQIDFFALLPRLGNHVALTAPADAAVARLAGGPPRAVFGGAGCSGPSRDCPDGAGVLCASAVADGSGRVLQPSWNSFPRPQPRVRRPPRAVTRARQRSSKARSSAVAAAGKRTSPSRL